MRSRRRIAGKRCAAGVKSALQAVIDSSAGSAGPGGGETRAGAEMESRRAELSASLGPGGCGISTLLHRKHVVSLPKYAGIISCGGAADRVVGAPSARPLLTSASAATRGR